MFCKLSSSPHARRLLARSLQSRSLQVFGPAQELPLADFSAAQVDLGKRLATLQNLDRQLQETSAGVLKLRKLSSVAKTTVGSWREHFRARLDSVIESEWAQGGVGWLWPRASEMYSHPHYLAVFADDGTASPADLPHGLGSLVGCIRSEALPVLEELLDTGLDCAPGCFSGRLDITKVIVHYYPEPTTTQALMSHAAFHSDDAFFTLNFESVPGMHSLRGRALAGPWIRHLTCEDDSFDCPANLFVGGYLQALSQGKWHSLIHSGSNPGPHERVSITCFLGIQPLNAFASSMLGAVRGQQEGEVHSLFGEVSQLDAGAANARFSQIQELFNLGDRFPQIYSARPNHLASTRRYWLVGSWDNWSAFCELTLKSAQCTGLSAQIPARVDEPVEFQILCDSAWNQRIVPSGLQGVLFGPGAHGHGLNFKLGGTSTRPAILQVDWDPAGAGSLWYGWVAAAKS